MRVVDRRPVFVSGIGVLILGLQTITKFIDEGLAELICLLVHSPTQRSLDDE